MCSECWVKFSTRNKTKETSGVRVLRNLMPENTPANRRDSLIYSSFQCVDKFDDQCYSVPLVVSVTASVVDSWGQVWHPDF